MQISKSPILVSSIVVLIFLVGLYLGTKYDSSKTPEKDAETTDIEKEEPITLLINPSFSKTVTYKAPDDYATFDVFYPQFENAGAEFNKKIEDFVLSGINNHKQQSKDTWQARYETKLPGEKISEIPPKDQKYPFSVSWTPSQVNEKFISFLLVFSAYTGGAHGYESTTSFNYDVLLKKEISLKDLFPSDANYLKTISEFSREDLANQFREKLQIVTKAEEQNFKDFTLPMIIDGTKPDEKNFRVFTFTPDSIIFHFAEYQIAPYAMGQSTVTMPR